MKTTTRRATAKTRLLTVHVDPTEVISNEPVETLKDAPDLVTGFKEYDVPFALECAGVDNTDGGCPFVMGLIQAVQAVKTSDTHGWGIPMHVRLSAVVAIARELGLLVSP